MTNEEKVLEQIRMQKQNAEDCLIEFDMLEFLEKALEENTKLKAEIEVGVNMIKTMAESYDKQCDQIENLKEEIEARKKASIKHNSDTREEIEKLEFEIATLKSNIGGMNLGAVLALQGVKEKTVTIVNELKRKGFDKPNGFAVLQGYIEDRLSELRGVVENERRE